MIIISTFRGPRSKKRLRTTALVWSTECHLKFLHFLNSDMINDSHVSETNLEQTFGEFKNFISNFYQIKSKA